MAAINIHFVGCFSFISSTKWRRFVFQARLRLHFICHSAEELLLHRHANVEDPAAIEVSKLGLDGATGGCAREIASSKTNCFSTRLRGRRTRVAPQLPTCICIRSFWRRGQQGRKPTVYSFPKQQKKPTKLIANDKKIV